MEECGLRCNAINLRFRDKYIGGEETMSRPYRLGRHNFMQEAADACAESWEEIR